MTKSSELRSPNVRTRELKEVLWERPVQVNLFSKLAAYRMIWSCCFMIRLFSVLNKLVRMPNDKPAGC